MLCVALSLSRDIEAYIVQCGELQIFMKSGAFVTHEQRLTVRRAARLQQL